MIKPFLISFFAYIGLDLIWFAVFMRNFALRELRTIGRIEDGNFKVHYGAVVMVYLLTSLAIAFFVLPKAEPSTEWWRVMLIGSVMGLIMYGVYDMTNLALLKDYTLRFALVDMVWGAASSGLVAVLAHRFQ